MRKEPASEAFQGTEVVIHPNTWPARQPIKFALATVAKNSA
jgi:hypothetical protein